MGFWDYFEIAIFFAMCAYFLWTGFRLLSGGEARIPGYSYMTEKDQACYDLPKLKRFYGVGNLLAALSAVLLLVGQFGGHRILIFVGLLFLVVGYGVPYQLFKRSDFFIKK
jgi:hypothetical protein